MRRLICTACVSFIFCFPVSNLLAGTYSGGTGDPNTPYWLADANDLLELAETTDDYDKYFILTADIDLDGQTFDTAVIAPDTTTDISFDGTKFTGTFDGNGYTICNLNIDTTNGYYVGLFGYIGSGGQITGLGLENLTISSNANLVGVLCGYNLGTISVCYATGEVLGNDCVGALCGVNLGTLDNCYATGTVTGSGSYVGGLCGWNSSGTISTCYATGTVTGSKNIGGLCGYQYGNEAIIQNSFWDIDTSGCTVGYNLNSSYSGTITHVVGKTTARMKTLSTFTDAGWDFTQTWGIGNGQTYPCLRQFTGFHFADINYSGTVDVQDLAILAANWLIRTISE